MKKSISASELVRYAQGGVGPTTIDDVVEWFDDQPAAVRETTEALLNEYVTQKAAKNKIAIVHALSTLVINHNGVLSKNKILSEPSYLLDRLNRIENAIRSPEEIVISRRREEDLAAQSSVLSGTDIKFYAPEGRCGSRLEIHDEKSVPIYGLLQADLTPGMVEQRRDTRWIVGRQASVAWLEQMCDELGADGRDDDLLTDIQKSRRAMRIIAICADVLEAKGINLLEDSDRLQEFTSKNKTIIIDALQAQITKCANASTQEALTAGTGTDEDPVIVVDIAHPQRYKLAFELLEINGDELICDALSGETPEDEATTSQLCEAA